MLIFPSSIFLSTSVWQAELGMSLSPYVLGEWSTQGKGCGDRWACFYKWSLLRSQKVLYFGWLRNTSAVCRSSLLLVQHALTCQANQVLSWHCLQSSAFLCWATASKAHTCSAWELGSCISIGMSHSLNLEGRLGEEVGLGLWVFPVPNRRWCDARRIQLQHLVEVLSEKHFLSNGLSICHKAVALSCIDDSFPLQSLCQQWDWEWSWGYHGPTVRGGE